MALSPLNSSQELSSKDLFEMLGKIYTQKNIQAQAEQDKKASEEKAQFQKAIIENEILFNQLIQLLEEYSRSEALKKQLQEFAEQNGFDSAANILNQLQNQFGKSPLTHAFQNQDFVLAKSLMNNGAEVGPIERAAFEISLDSQAAKDAGFADLVSKKPELHTVKKYGLTLGIQMTSKDGTSSQFGHIQPTFQLMSDSVKDFAKSSPANQDFKAIAEAYEFSNKAAAFSHSTSQRNPAAGQDMAKRIQSGEITTIPINCKGHAMGMSVVPDGPGSKSGYLVYTNRGDGCKFGESGTKIYRLDDVSKITPEFINAAMNGHHNGASHDDQMRLLEKVTEGREPVHFIEQKAQKYDNCTIANTRSNIHGISLCQKAKEKGGFDKLEKHDFDSAKKNYKEFTHHMRESKVKELASEIAKNPNDPDLKNLAKNYLKTHPNASPSLREPLEKALKEQTVENKTAIHLGRM